MDHPTAGRSFRRSILPSYYIEDCRIFYQQLLLKLIGFIHIFCILVELLISMSFLKNTKATREKFFGTFLNLFKPFQFIGHFLSIVDMEDVCGNIWIVFEKSWPTSQLSVKHKRFVPFSKPQIKKWDAKQKIENRFSK